MNIISGKKINQLFILLLSGTLIISCSYSFTGASVPEHLKSISIPISKDQSGSGEPALSDNFTNELITKFEDDNTLSVADKVNANAILECTILALSDAPAIVSSGEDVTSRRITIRVKVVYKDFVERKTVFDRSFSNFGDYVNQGDIQTVRTQAINTALDKITEDILLAVVSNW